MDLRATSDRTLHLHMRLLHETDVLKRAGLHLELAALQITDGQFEQAGRHLREALHFDQTLDGARAQLRELGQGPVKVSGLRALFSKKR